mmetsp:Transcript_1100/g.2632  ORF Transcript_1100/g.2632 Transcript_1100/m.2632 type:complete len:598 (+) Transcript_1100:290-2083(+)
MFHGQVARHHPWSFNRMHVRESTAEWMARRGARDTSRARPSGHPRRYGGERGFSAHRNRRVPRHHVHLVQDRHELGDGVVLVVHGLDLHLVDEALASLLVVVQRGHARLRPSDAVHQVGDDAHVGVGALQDGVGRALDLLHAVAAHVAPRLVHVRDLVRRARLGEDDGVLLVVEDGVQVGEVARALEALRGRGLVRLGGRRAQLARHLGQHRLERGGGGLAHVGRAAGLLARRRLHAALEELGGRRPRRALPLPLRTLRRGEGLRRAAEEAAAHLLQEVVDVPPVVERDAAEVLLREQLAVDVDARGVGHVAQHTHAVVHELARDLGERLLRVGGRRAADRHARARLRLLAQRAPRRRLARHLRHHRDHRRRGRRAHVRLTVGLLRGGRLQPRLQVDVAGLPRLVLPRDRRVGELLQPLVHRQLPPQQAARDFAQEGVDVRRVDVGQAAELQLRERLAVDVQARRRVGDVEDQPLVVADDRVRRLAASLGRVRRGDAVGVVHLQEAEVGPRGGGGDELRVRQRAHRAHGAVLDRRRLDRRGVVGDVAVRVEQRRDAQCVVERLAVGGVVDQAELERLPASNPRFEEREHRRLRRRAL